MTDERAGRYFREARFFLAGDKVAAQSHILEARSLMGYMRDMQALGGPSIQVKYATLQDGTQIKAVMMNGQYQAQIFSPAPSFGVVEPAVAGVLICRPFDDTIAASGWGEAFTYDADGNATAGTPGGAHPYVIFGDQAVVRQPNIPTTFPWLPGLYAADPQYGRGPNTWADEPRSTVYSWQDWYVYHRGFQVLNAHTQIQTLAYGAGSPIMITAGRVIAAGKHAESGRVLVFVRFDGTADGGTAGSAVLEYQQLGTPGAYYLSFKSVVWQTAHAMSGTARQSVFNHDGSRLAANFPLYGAMARTTKVAAFAWNAGTATMSASVSDYPTAIVSSRTGDCDLGGADTTLDCTDVADYPLGVCWRGDSPCLVRTHTTLHRTQYSVYNPASPFNPDVYESYDFTRRYYVQNVETAAETTILDGLGYSSSSFSTVTATSTFTGDVTDFVLFDWDYWASKYVGSRATSTETGLYPPMGSWDWKLQYITESGATHTLDSFLHTGDKTAMPTRLLWCEAQELAVRLICSSYYVPVAHIAFGKDTLLCATGETLKYFDGLVVRSAASMLGVASTTSSTTPDCTTKTYDSSRFYVGTI